MRILPFFSPKKSEIIPPMQYSFSLSSMLMQQWSTILEVCTLSSLIIFTNFVFQLWYLLEIFQIQSGMVAENIRHCTFLQGLIMQANIFYISYLNPMLSISSASSKQTISMESKFNAFLSSKSLILPGVPTMMSTPLFKAAICSCMFLPPQTAKVQKSFQLHRRLFIYSKTWSASYLVGRITRNLGLRGFLNMPRCISCKMHGRAKAMVLPDPVLSRAMICSPQQIVAKVQYCIGINDFMPFFLSASIIFQSLTQLVMLALSGNTVVDILRRGWLSFQFQIILLQLNWQLYKFNFPSNIILQLVHFIEYNSLALEQLLYLTNLNLLMQNQDNLALQTHNKISKLMEDLNIGLTQRQPQQYKNQATNNHLKQLKQMMNEKYTNLNEKVLSANAVLGEVQKQINQGRDSTRSIRVRAAHNEKIEAIEQDAKDFFKQLQNVKDELNKVLANRILQMKLLKVEQQQSERYASQQQQVKQQMDGLIAQMKKQLRQGTIQNKLQIASLQLSTKIKAAKRNVEEDGQRNKQHLKEMKSKILTVCQKVEEDLNNEEKALNESFKMHFDTLQKLVVSISDRIA